MCAPPGTRTSPATASTDPALVCTGAKRGAAGRGRVPGSGQGTHIHPRGGPARACATLLPHPQDNSCLSSPPPFPAGQQLAQRSAEHSRCVVRPWQTASHQPERLSHGERLRTLPQGQQLASGLQGRGSPPPPRRAVESLRATGHPATGQQDPARSSQNTNFPRETGHKLSNARAKASAPGHGLEAKRCPLSRLSSPAQ